MSSSDVVYTLTVHDEKYPGMPDQAAGVYGGENALNAAAAAARSHWAELAGPDAMKLDFSSYESSNTGLDFHVAFGYHSYENAKVTYSVNGFTVQRG
jgi:hypothetical protein